MAQADDGTTPVRMGPLFDNPLPTGELARVSHPETSHEAAEAMKGSKELKGAQRLALSLVKSYPGRTAMELHAISGDRDSRRIGRRLRELARNQKARTEKGGPVCSVTNRHALRWYPIEG